MSSGLPAPAFAADGLQSILRVFCISFKTKSTTTMYQFRGYHGRHRLAQHAVLLQAPGVKQVTATPTPPVSTQSEWKP